jgi:hypothetical protein
MALTDPQWATVIAAGVVMVHTTVSALALARLIREQTARIELQLAALSRVMPRRPWFDVHVGDVVDGWTVTQRSVSSFARTSIYTMTDGSTSMSVDAAWDEPARVPVPTNGA